MGLRRRPARSWLLLVVPVLATALALPVLTAPPASAAGLLTVVVNGPGRVTGDGIDCTSSGGPDCSEQTGSAVLTSVVPDGYQRTWSGCPLPLGNTCTLLLVNGATTVTASFEDVQAPSKPVLDPASGTVNGTLVVTASTSDNSGAVERVRFYEGAVQIGVDTTAPYQLELYSPALTEGPLEVTAVARDAAGLESAAGVGSYTVDNGPATEILKAPRRTVRIDGRSTVARFLFATDEEGATFECVLDRKLRPCGGSAKFRVERGRHTLRVTAVDADGHRDPTPAVHQWRVVRR